MSLFSNSMNFFQIRWIFQNRWFFFQNRWTFFQFGELCFKLANFFLESMNFFKILWTIFQNLWTFWIGQRLCCMFMDFFENCEVSFLFIENHLELYGGSSFPVGRSFSWGVFALLIQFYAPLWAGPQGVVVSAGWVGAPLFLAGRSYLAVSAPIYVTSGQSVALISRPN